MAIQIVCDTCGSSDVRRDAWAEWNVEMQKWVLQNIFDDGFCERCECHSSLTEKPLLKLVSQP